MPRRAVGRALGQHLAEIEEVFVGEAAAMAVDEEGAGLAVVEGADRKGLSGKASGQGRRDIGLVHPRHLRASRFGHALAVARVAGGGGDQVERTGEMRRAADLVALEPACGKDDMAGTKLRAVLQCHAFDAVWPPPRLPQTCRRGSMPRATADWR